MAVYDTAQVLDLVIDSLEELESGCKEDLVEDPEFPLPKTENSDLRVNFTTIKLTSYEKQ